MKKVCSKCKLEKDIKEFFKDKRTKDGLYTACKKCHQLYSLDPKRVKKNKKYQKVYRKVDKNKIRSREYHKNYHFLIINDIRKKFLCRQQTNKFVREGIIKKLPCAVCGKLKSQAHHKDYNNSKDVIWLCIKHHAELHQELRKNV